MIAIKHKLFAVRMSKAVLIIFIVPLNYCVALFAHPSQMLSGCIISTFCSSAGAYANSEMSRLLSRASVPAKAARLKRSSAPFFGPAASPPLHADLNFLINTFSLLPAKGEGRRLPEARNRILLASCGTPPRNSCILIRKQLSGRLAAVAVGCT